MFLNTFKPNQLNQIIGLNAQGSGSAWTRLHVNVALKLWSVKLLQYAPSHRGYVYFSLNFNPDSDGCQAAKEQFDCLSTAVKNWARRCAQKTHPIKSAFKETLFPAIICHRQVLIRRPCSGEGNIWAVQAVVHEMQSGTLNYAATYTWDTRWAELRSGTKREPPWAGADYSKISGCYLGRAHQLRRGFLFLFFNVGQSKNRLHMA